MKITFICKLFKEDY